MQFVSSSHPAASGKNFCNQTLIGPKHALKFGNTQDFFYPGFICKPEENEIQLEILQKLFSENVINVVGPVLPDSEEIKTLAKAGFKPCWHGSGNQKCLFYNNLLASKKLFQQNGSLIIGANLVITFDCDGKAGAVVVHDPSKGAFGLTNPQGTADTVIIDPHAATEDVLKEMDAICRETAIKEGKEEVPGLEIEKHLLRSIGALIGPPTPKEILGDEWNKDPTTSNAPLQTSIAYNVHYKGQEALKMLKTIGFDIDQAFPENDFPRIVSKVNTATGTSENAEKDEIERLILIPQRFLKGCKEVRIDDLAKIMGGHNLLLIQTALKINGFIDLNELAANCSYLPFFIDSEKQVINEIQIVENGGEWMKNFCVVREFLVTVQELFGNLFKSPEEL